MNDDRHARDRSYDLDPSHRPRHLLLTVRALDREAQRRLVDDIERENERRLVLLDTLIGAEAVTPDGPQFEFWNAVCCERLRLSDALDEARIPAERLVHGRRLAKLLERRYEVKMREGWHLAVWAYLYRGSSAATAWS